jgi:O-antigen/teichoic acid export membrane protein
MFRTSLALAFVLSLILLSLFLPFSSYVASLLFKSKTYAYAIVFASLWAVGRILNQQIFAYYRARQDARSYVAISVASFLALMVLNISFVRWLKLGLPGVLWGNIIVTWAINLWGIGKFYRYKRTISLQWAGRLFRFGAPLVFSMIGWFILNSADRYFLAYYRDLSEVGVYGLGYKVGLIAQMVVISPFQLAWGPFVFARFAADERNLTQDFSKFFTYLLVTFILVGLGLTLFSREIVAVLGSGKFKLSVRVVPYVLLAYLFNGIYYWAASLFYLRDRTGLLGAIVFGMAVLNLLLNWMLVPSQGWFGAALATVVTVGGVGILALLVGQLLYRVPLQIGRLTKIAVSTSVILIVYFFSPIPAGMLGWITRVTLVVLFPALLVMMGFLEPAEKKFFETLPHALREYLFSR